MIWFTEALTQERKGNDLHTREEVFRKKRENRFLFSHHCGKEKIEIIY
jgi:hypothetical protein